MHDLISRQAVLEILSRKNAAWDAYEQVKQLPAASPHQDIEEFNLFNKEEIYPNCTVQVLSNTFTGAQSVGWWINT